MTDGRSVVLVTIDSLRADHCGYVAGGDLTPAIDALADDGVAFTNAIAPGPTTYESMPAIFTGRPLCPYPTAGDTLEQRATLIDRNMRTQTLPEWFARHGYATAAFTTNPYTAGHTAFSRGFDRYEDFLGGGEGPLMRRAAHLPVLAELKHLVTLVRGDRASKPWDAYYPDVTAWLSAAGEPYFLWVFLLDPHTPYLPPGNYRPFGRLPTYYHNWRLWVAKKWTLDMAPDQEAIRELYAASVRYADAFVDRLVDDLPGDPVVAVHADHGEALGEHGRYGHGPALFEENVHVPCVVAAGDLPDRTVSTPTPLTALPRILRTAATSRTACTISPDSEYATSRTVSPGNMALRGRTWKYIASTSEGTVSHETLYDLAADPGETTDRSDARQPAVAACRSVAERRLAHERELTAVARAALGVQG